LGSEECPVSPEDKEIEYSMIFRIPKIEGLEQCTVLKVSFSYTYNYTILDLGPSKEFDQEN
jgi:hypothetical protein